MSSLTIFAAFTVAIIGQSLALQSQYNQKIFGGKNATEGQFPFMVNIEWSHGGHFCGGSVLNKNWIVSAAHCLRHKDSKDVVFIVGQTNLRKEGQRHASSKFVFHPDLNTDDWFMDTALAKMDTPITFTKNIQPIRLETDLNIPGGKLATVIGWGDTESIFVTKNLLYVHVKTVTDEECQSKHYRPVYDINICTSTEGEKGACFGDSGGPLVLEGKLIGTVSWGQPCALGYPDVFVKIAAVES